MKLIYKPFAVILGLFAGFLSKKLFDQIWGLIDKEEPPKPNTEQATWPKVLAAAAVQGVTFRVTRAAVERAGREGLRRPHRLLAGREGARARGGLGLRSGRSGSARRATTARCACRG